MFYIAVILTSALLCLAVAIFLKKSFFDFVVSAAAQMNINLNNSLEEVEKEKQVLKHLGRFFGNTARFFALLILVVVLCLLPIYLLVRFRPEMPVDTRSIYFYLSMIGGSMVVFLLPKGKSDYSYWSRLLHTAILDNYDLGKFLFRKEKKKVTLDGRAANFVLVSGLARAGTTALTNQLHDTGQFHSITYANMPFLLAPGFWRRFYKANNSAEGIPSGKAKERAHGDKVMVTQGSIEALEEYFFKAFTDDAYIAQDTLKVHSVNESIYTDYLAYQQLFRHKGDETSYLAKNNNSILRYKSLRQHNPDFKFVVMFRAPLEHAGSLLRQHRNFCKQQSDDPFVQQYMTWLGHHEFGLNHKLFDLGGASNIEGRDPDTIDYWLGVWINYYQYALDLPAAQNTFFVCYRDLLLHPNELLASLSSALETPFEHTPIAPFKRPVYDPDATSVDEELLQFARELYTRLLELKLEV